jgi:outer membrane receptor for monomeric catechols
VRILFIQPDGNGGIAQDGAETNKGYEADIGTSFQTPLGQLQAILTYYKGDQKNSLGIMPDGVANDTWSAFLSQAINVGPLNRYKVGFGMYRKGTVPFGSGAGQLNKFWGPAYTTSTAMVSYEAKTYRLALNLDNVFDKDFIEGGENATWLYTNPGLTWKLSAEYRF